MHLCASFTQSDETAAAAFGSTRWSNVKGVNAEESDSGEEDVVGEEERGEGAEAGISQSTQ